MAPNATEVGPKESLQFHDVTAVRGPKVVPPFEVGPAMSVQVVAVVRVKTPIPLFGVAKATSVSCSFAELDVDALAGCVSSINADAVRARRPMKLDTW